MCYDDMLYKFTFYILTSELISLITRAGGGQHHYSNDNEPVWQLQHGVDSTSSPRGHASVNGTRYVDDGYGGDLDSSGHFSLEHGFTQQQVNGVLRWCCCRADERHGYPPKVTKGLFVVKDKV